VNAQTENQPNTQERRQPPFDREEMLKEFDKDGDGELNDEERRTMFESMRERMGRGGFGPSGFGGGRRGGPGFQREKLIAKFDTDGDGKLNNEERKAAREYVQEGMGDRRGFQRPGRKAPQSEAEKQSDFSEPKTSIEDDIKKSSENANSKAALYDEKVLRTLYLRFQNADWHEEIADFYRTDVDVPADLIVDGKAYPSVGIHFRGTTSYTIIISLVFGMAFFSLASNQNGPDYKLVFENDDILSFHITVAYEDCLKMQDMSFPYVKCTIRFGDEVYEDVGLRFKGNSSSMVKGLKKSFKFKFDKFEKKQRFHGFKKLNFQNGFRDPSLLREKLAYDLFSEAGVPASRATFAKLYLTIDGHYDDEYIGLYTLVEQVDKVFLNDRFSDTSGNLFKYEGMFGFVYKGDAKEAYEKEYEAKLSKKQRDYSVLIRFIKMLNDGFDTPSALNPAPPEERFPEEIEKAFNVENFLSWLAVNTLLSSLDSYAGSGHNYYLYYNKDTGKFEFIPWDLNEAFGNHHRMASAQDMMELDIYEPYAKPKSFLERILRVPIFKERYIAKMKALLDGPFQQSAMYQKIDALYQRIEKDVRLDTREYFTTEDFERSIDNHIQSKRGPIITFSGLKPFVAERIKSVKAQLTGQKRGFVPRPFKQSSGAPPSPPHGGE